MKTIERNKARALRKTGYSMNEIVARLGVSKSSVSLWVRDIELTKHHRDNISQKGRSVDSIEKRRISRLKNEQMKTDIVIDQAKKEIKKFSFEDLKLAGIIMYWAEGGKTRRGIVRVANSDPDVIKLMMRFFREVCNVPESKFRGYIHAFDHSDVQDLEKHWSSISGISRNQFYKTYTKQSSASLLKRQTLPKGTFDIYVSDTKLFLRIMGWIAKIKELSLR